ncbi:VOC family protein [Roseomonas sp. CCTCC AB2023176]|uniref:VOC family protein n=1 Tax=Roseomonas sp. CCTCC AB2023176 TaxID=3342640 RepID=UPI0035DBDF1A
MIDPTSETRRMPRAIFVNLPVTDLPRAIAFYEALGGRREPRFSDNTAACMVLSEAISIMLLIHPKFAGFTPRPVSDARAATEVLLCIPVDSREAVDATIEATAAAGGSPDPAPRQDQGFMVGRSVEDPDGHIWEVIWMDMAAFDAAKAGCAPEQTA